MRKALEMTQRQFAKVLKVAAVTLAQWETTRPPQGEQLDNLIEIAHKERLRSEQQSDVAKGLKLKRLEQRLRRLRMAEAIDKFGVDIHLFHATEEDDADGYAFLRLHGFDQMMSIQTLRFFWEIIDLPETPKTKATRDIATKAIKALNDALIAIDENAYKKQHDFTEALQYVEQLTITIKPKEGTTTK